MDIPPECSYIYCIHSIYSLAFLDIFCSLDVIIEIEFPYLAPVGRTNTLSDVLFILLYCAIYYYIITTM
jgi:hypothetical protein